MRRLPILRSLVLLIALFSSCRREASSPQTHAVTPPGESASEVPSPAAAPGPPAMVPVPAPPREEQPYDLPPSPDKPAVVSPPPATAKPEPAPEPEHFVVESCDPNLPGPERAKAAAARVRPELEKALTAAGLRFGDPVFLRAFKEEGDLEMWILNRTTKKYDLFRTWKIAAASGRLGPKLIEGDGQVPEGFYAVPSTAMKPDSAFHLAFNVGYPNEYDRSHHRTGSFIMIHGNRVSIGCLAMTDTRIEEIYTLCDAALKKGQPFFRVNIFPFRMTDERMAAHANSPWHDFWSNLREGHDRFEKTHLPPETAVAKGRYTFK